MPGRIRNILKYHSITHAQYPTSAHNMSGSGMTDYRDSGGFVGQSGATCFGSDNVGKLNQVKNEGICKNEQ